MTRLSFSGFLLAFFFLSNALAPAFAVHRDETSEKRQRRPEPPPVSAQQALEMGWFLPGQELKSAADSEAEVLIRLDQLSILPVSAEEGPWQEVTFQGKKAWIDSRWQIPWDPKKSTRSLKRQIYERPFQTNRRQLRGAKKILGVDEPARTFGDMELYTDIEDAPLFDFLERIVAITPDAYFARFGRLPTGKLQETILIFKDREDYRQYSRDYRKGRSQNSGGHAGAGLIVVWQGDRSPISLASILIHEITHILNDHALARRVQPWLEEGIASDLGGLWIEEKPENWVAPIQLGALDRSIYGLYSRKKRHEMPGIGALSTLDRQAFSYSEYTGLAYGHAASLIRYLAHDDNHGVGFRRFLERIARQELKGNMGLLLDTLDIDIETLDQSFRAWVHQKGSEIWAGER